MHPRSQISCFIIKGFVSTAAAALHARVLGEEFGGGGGGRAHNPGSGFSRWRSQMLQEPQDGRLEGPAPAHDSEAPSCSMPPRNACGIACSGFLSAQMRPPTLDASGPGRGGGGQNGEHLPKTDLQTDTPGACCPLSPSRSSVPPSQGRSSTSSVTRHQNSSSASVYLGSSAWCACSFRTFKFHGCIPQTQHGSLRIV